MTRRGSLTAPAFALILVALSSTPMSAQLPNADTRALGMAGNFTAVVRGHAAARWNPALLGFADGERLTFALGPMTADLASAPVSWRHWGPFESDSVPEVERERWLAMVEDEGSQRGAASAEVTYLTGSLRHFALQVSTVARARAYLSPGAAELGLFGNYGRTSEVCTCPLTGTELDGHAVSTLAFSAGFPVRELLGGEAAVGATLKYSVGHGFLHGVDAGSTVGPDPTIDVTFPMVMTDTAADFGSGSGVGLDLGFALRRDNLTFGASLQNVLQTFSWDDTQLTYREGTAIFSREVQLAEANREPFGNAPASLRQFVEERSFARVLSLGMGVDPRDNVTVAADLRARLGDEGMDATPSVHVGVGGEVRWSVVALRAGAAVVSGGYQLGGGVGLALGPARIGAAVMRRETDGGTDLVGMITLLSFAR